MRIEGGGEVGAYLGILIKKTRYQKFLLQILGRLGIYEELEEFNPYDYRISRTNVYLLC